MEKIPQSFIMNNVEEFFRGKKPNSWEEYGDQVKNMSSYIRDKIDSAFPVGFQQNEYLDGIHSRLTKLDEFNLEAFQDYSVQFDEQKSAFYDFLLQAAVASDGLEKSDTSFEVVGAGGNEVFNRIKEKLSEAVAIYDVALEKYSEA